MEISLEGKVAVISGGANGIGRSMVETFANAGAKVSFIDKDQQAGEEVVRQLSSQLPNLYFYHGDVTDVAIVEDYIGLTANRFGRLDILVNNAGVNDFVGLEDSPEKFLESLDRNLHHYFYMAHFALPHLKDSRGTIINVSSKVALMGEGHTSGYAAAKGGILGLTKEWALDLAKYGIRVNAILPGQVLTPQAERYFSTQPGGKELKARLEGFIPLGRRFTTPQEVANTALYLASDLASPVTGTEHFPNGGYALDVRFLDKPE